MPLTDSQIKLIEILSDLESYSDGSLIFAAKVHEKWHPDGLAEIVELGMDEDDEDVMAPEGTSYFIEVFLARQILNKFRQDFSDEQADETQKCRAVIYYVENDSYLTSLVFRES